MIHRNTAKQLIPIRDELRYLIADIKSNDLTYDEIINKRNKLSEKAKLIYSLAPQTSVEAYSLSEEELENQ